MGKNLLERCGQEFKILRELFAMIVAHKKWTLLPVFFILSIFSLFMVLAGGSSILPAIYVLF